MFEPGSQKHLAEMNRRQNEEYAKKEEAERLRQQENQRRSESRKYWAAFIVSSVAAVASVASLVLQFLSR